MRKDIEIPKVEDVGVAIVQEQNELGGDEWRVYMLNFQNVIIEGVLVSSRGYGKKDDEDIKTSMLRHYIGMIEPKSFKRVELITEEVFGLTNEYWVSYFHDNKMFDKKFIFVAGSIEQGNLTTVPLINKKGILIR